MGSEIYRSIRNSKAHHKQKKLIIGDSAGYQLFPNAETDSNTISLACNQAISMVGHFCLLVNYLNAGNEIDTLYMIFGHEGFLNNLDQVYTFHYFLKPFYNKEYKGYFSEKVMDQIMKIPQRNLCREPYILTSNWAPNFKSQDTIQYTFISPISEEYLNRIRILSEEKDFTIIIVPPPISFSQKAEVDRINKDEIINSSFGSELQMYFDSIEYLPDTCFLDGIHLKDPTKYAPHFKSKWKI